jgi:endonuclease/exonuclease/phosphatase (EEP) superfamily protein YafD
MRLRNFFIILSISVVFTHCSENKPTAPIQTSGDFSLLTYNVAGLPQGISPSNPEKNIPLISPLLNKFDIALVQEDFYYHDELKAKAQHPYQSEPQNAPSQFIFADGLNRFSVFPFATLYRETWGICSNENGYDCLATKGLAVAETEIAPGVVIDIYNLHLDAGGTPQDFEARRSQIQQLLQTINSRSAEKALIVAGDINLNTVTRPLDVVLLQDLLDSAGLTDTCRFLSCGIELVDLVLFRSSSSLTLSPIAWELDPDFVDEQGDPLSDHFAVSVKFSWELR